MRIVYLGTPDFAVQPLKRIVESGKYQVVAVVTNKDKPVGRKKVLTAPPVKQYALEQGIPVFQYDKIRVEGVKDLTALAPDLMITCAFGQILSQEILDIAPLGVINIHASLLPKYRGASPIHYAILNGETKTGISVMKTDIGIDTGDVMLQKSIDIGELETCGELFDRLSVLGGDCILEVLEQIQSNTVTYQKQNEELATLTRMIKKEHAVIDWSKTAREIVNQVRAFNPAPVATTIYNGQPLKVYKAEVSNLKGGVGEVVASIDSLVVGCIDKAVSLIKVQKAGGNAMDIKDFLRGNKVAVGEILG